MSDESEDPRRVGRDEMNLAEFPITLLTERVPPGCKTMVFEDQHGKLTVIGSDAYGLPTALDSDVIVILIQLTKMRNDFTDPTVEFTRYELLKLLGWEDRGRNYRRLSESLRRWVGVSLHYDGCWWDNKRKRRTSASFHILDYVVLPDADDPGETIVLRLEQDLLQELPGREPQAARPRHLLRAEERRQQAALSVPRQTVLSPA